jgi:hypothetical protein
MSFIIYSVDLIMDVNEDWLFYDVEKNEEHSDEDDDRIIEVHMYPCGWVEWILTMIFGKMETD